MEYVCTEEPFKLCNSLLLVEGSHTLHVVGVYDGTYQNNER